MATMIPSDIDSFKTRGEESFYRFLEIAAKPDRRYTSWYLPDVEGREPDFILFSEEQGLIVFEVKDWSLDQIREASPRSFTLKMGHELRQLKNPLHQAREYFETLMDRIREDGRLLSQDPGYFGKPKVPIDYGLVFPNIRRDPYCVRGLDRIISPRRIFFRDDLDLDSGTCRDPSGECFRKALSEMFPPRFRFSINEEEYHHLKQLLFPVVRIEDAPRDACLYVDPLVRSRALDDTQENLARRTAPGLHLVAGPPGSGKTLVLVHKAAFLNLYGAAARHRAAEADSTDPVRILFLCANVTLVRHVKRLLAEKGVGTGPGGVEVLAFRDLCSQVLGEPVSFAGEESEYAELVLSETLDRLKRGEGPRFDALLVDDGHEFTALMREIAFALLGEGPGKSVTVGLDVTPRARKRASGWGAQAKHGMKTRRDELERIYRNTTEIRDFWLRFRDGVDAGKAVEKDSIQCEVHGPHPHFEKLGDEADLVNHVAELIRRIASGGEYPLSEMAVLIAGGVDGRAEQDRALAARMVAALEAGGTLAQWVTEDDRSRAGYDITTDRVSVSSVGGIRGLDYACVVLAGLDLLDTPVERAEELARLGISRARHRLVIPYAVKTPLIERLMAAL